MVPGTTNASGIASADAKYNATTVAEAVALAKAADVAIVVIGSDLKMAAEGHDLGNLSITDGQARLVQEVAAAAAKPIVVVTITANAIDVSPLLANPQVGAILHAGIPSMATAGVADVLFGDVVPAGRTIQTIYPPDWQNSISILDMGMRPGPSLFPRPDCQQPHQKCPNATNQGRTHRFYQGKAAVPFGTWPSSCNLLSPRWYRAAFSQPSDPCWCPSSRTS